MSVFDTAEQDGENILLYFSSLWVEVLWYIIFPLLFSMSDKIASWNKGRRGIE